MGDETDPGKIRSTENTDHTPDPKESGAERAELPTDVEVDSEQLARLEKEQASRKAQIARLQARQQKSALTSKTAAASANLSSEPGSPHQVVDDEAEDEDEFLDELEDDEYTESRQRTKRRGLYCFNCNRPEGHSLYFSRNIFYSFVIGMTFGLAIIFGPYRCQCCGSQRLMSSNLLNPRYHLALLSRREKRTRKRRSRS